MWCHLPTGLEPRRAVRFVALVLLLVAFITTLLFATVTSAAPYTSKTINFQGRLQTAAGAVVGDGHYNMQFKIYQDGTGSVAGNPGGNLNWTETHTNNGGTSGIEVKNGFFTVNLGAQNPFGTSVDWNQDTLFLSMNVAGSNTNCLNFGTAPCAADGEMLPMKRITATPYALNAGALEGKSASNFVQLGQGVQTDVSQNTSSIHIDKVGSGNFLQLENAGEDVLAINQNGDLQFGGTSDHVIEVGTGAPDTHGGNLRVTAGSGGTGSDTEGGTLRLQGGQAGGTDENGGNVAIDAGHATGSGSDGYISIGTSVASNIIIGSTYQPMYQGIYLGANETDGSWTDVTVGSSGAGGGTTSIRGSNGVTIESGGVTKATFSDTTNTVYFGNGVSSATPSNSTLQGTDSSASSIAGGTLTVQGGNATTGNTKGGNLVLSGGTGSGTGANGLVVINTPTFSTVANDANCYADGAIVATSCTITKSSVDNSAAIIVGFSATSRTATLPDPTTTTAGRLMYIVAATNSQNFTLSFNDGGTGNTLAVAKNTAITFIWNGADWIPSVSSSAGMAQNVSPANLQAMGSDELSLMTESTTDDPTVSKASPTSLENAPLEVSSTPTDTLLSGESTVIENQDFASDGTVNNSASFETSWSAVGGASVERTTLDGQEAQDSAKVMAGTKAHSGIQNTLSHNPLATTQYKVSVYSKLITGSAFTDFNIGYSPDGGATIETCKDYNTQTISTTAWVQVTCTIDTGAVSATDPIVTFTQATVAANPRTFLIDTFSFIPASNSSTPGIVEEANTSTNETGLFTLEGAASALTADHESLLGSMYYDTTKGKVQCYEAEGWGTCGASPDSFITLSPEYANAVMNGTDVGTIASDLCSDTLNINDGSASQPTICGTNETYNFYNWTSAESSTQTRSIYVTYKLPSNFKKFVAGSTSLMGRTDSSNAGITYQIYRDNTSTGLTSCGSIVSVSTGAQSIWQKAVATGSADPATCDFTAGDSVLLRINLTSKDNANAYVSNLGFTFSNDD